MNKNDLNNKGSQSAKEIGIVAHHTRKNTTNDYLLRKILESSLGQPKHDLVDNCKENQEDYPGEEKENKEVIAISL